MNIRPLILVAAAALSLAACGPSTDTTGAASPATSLATATSPGAAQVQVAFAQGTIKKGDQAVCVVCATNEGSTAAEEVHETIDYQGKTYAFCNETEKAEFISNPSKYAK